MTDTKPLDLPPELTRAFIANILATWPLYRSFEYTEKVETSSLPSNLELYCPSCKKNQYWSLSNKDPYVHGHGTAMYRCRNCGGEEIRFYFFWLRPKGEPFMFIKTGQYPALEERVTPELEAQLGAGEGSDLDYYKKAIRCRNFAYGLASLSYLRRVVENRLNDLLDLIAELARGSGFAAEEIAELEITKRSRTFEQKVSYAARILPPVLRPGGQNPVDLLHDLASEGIHKLGEQECLDIFDESRAVFEYLFRELKVRKADADAFLSGVKDLAARRAKRKKDPAARRSDA